LSPSKSGGPSLKYDAAQSDEELYGTIEPERWPMACAKALRFKIASSVMMGS
jgi:hypothetical protein